MERMSTEAVDLCIANWYMSWYKLDTIEKIGIIISLHVGWSTRGCCHRYDSISDHAVIIGVKTKKVIGIICYSMHCYKYKFAR